MCWVHGPQGTIFIASILYRQLTADCVQHTINCLWNAFVRMLPSCSYRADKVSKVDSWPSKFWNFEAVWKCVWLTGLNFYTPILHCIDADWCLDCIRHCSFFHARCHGHRGISDLCQEDTSVLYEMSESGLLPGQRMQEAIPAMSRKLENNTMGQHLIILHVEASLSILPTPLFFPKYNRLPLACCSSQNEWCIALYIAWIMDIAITASWFRYKLVMKFQQRFQFQISTPGQHCLKKRLRTSST